MKRSPIRVGKFKQELAVNNRNPTSQPLKEWAQLEKSGRLAANCEIKNTEHLINIDTF